MANEYIFIAEAEDAGLRLDKYLAESMDGVSRTYLQKLIDQNVVLVNDAPAAGKQKLKSGDRIFVSLPEPEKPEILPENIPLDIIYEDQDVILINKPKGMVVHPAPGHMSGTLVNALMYHCGDSLSGINGIMRPGIVHRIDRDTTGVMIACKNDAAHQCLAEQLKEHSITRVYEAICINPLTGDGTVDKPIGRHPEDRKKMAINEKNGRRAVTHYHLIENFGNRYAYISCRLETGRTHQIRVHMASIHHPLLGDTVYGSSRSNPNDSIRLNGVKIPLEGQVLHARIFGFRHPRTGAYMEFEAPLPAYFSNLLTQLKQFNK